MVSGIGKNIQEGFLFLIVLACLTCITIVYTVVRVYYYDEIIMGKQAATAIEVCESQIKRDEHCKLIIKAIPID